MSENKSTIDSASCFFVVKKKDTESIIFYRIFGTQPKAWKIEEYHRRIKQFYGVERCQARRNNVLTAHIMMAIRAFLRFEIQRITTGIHGLKQN